MARPTITLLAIEHHCLMAGTKLYCLVTEAHVCEQLAQGRYMTVEWLGVEPETCYETNLCASGPTGHICIQGAKLNQLCVVSMVISACTKGFAFEKVAGGSIFCCCLMLVEAQHKSQIEL